MSKSVNPEIKDVIDSVIAGDAAKLRRSLGYLAQAGGIGFLKVANDLLRQTQAEYVGWFGIDADVFYHSDTHVFGVVYTLGEMLTSKANPSGVGCRRTSSKKLLMQPELSMKPS